MAQTSKLPLYIRPQILALNKIDAVSSEVVASVQAQLALLVPVVPLTISAATRVGLDSLLQSVWAVLDRENPAKIENK